MKDRSRVSFGLAAALVAAAATALLAHDVPPQVTAFVKPTDDRLRVLVRIPTELLADPRIPVRADGYFDLQTGLDPNARPMSAIAADVVRNLDVMDDGRLLGSPLIAWTISPASDTSFETFRAAEARVTTLPPADARIDPTEALLDLQLEYPLQSTSHRPSIRVNGFRSLRGARMVVHYEPPSGASRTVVTSGAPTRLELEPRWQAVAAVFARLGIEQLAVGVVHLMFVLCLAVPARSMGLAWAVFGKFAAGWALATAVSALLPESSAPFLSMLQALSAAALVVAGIQNVAPPAFRWVNIVAVMFGLIDGFVFGATYRHDLSLAGSHSMISFVSFVVPILVGSVWLLLVAHPVFAFVRRTRLPERWATVLLSAIPIHAALHAMMARP